ncbi:hypothetical protein [Nocardioides mesophilus]|uniref:Uncharacterized protein n=1 Tax=Nocardioides mesophilus TaxID=433659 RepID=A0A7G9R9I6_9ACTN|nr:hypothetical protein [Nocardioides mesophilus]QNN52261.1 hypothetical protein H9L09_17510 [Nocardioides mesophilus]
MNALDALNPLHPFRLVKNIAGLPVAAVETAGSAAVGLAGTAVGLTGAALRATTRAVSSRVGHAEGDLIVGWVDETLVVVEDTVAEEEETSAPRGHVDDGHRHPAGPDTVFAEPAPPAEPPIDVVGQTLAAEEADLGGGGAGMAHEPRGASRDEEHGDAGLQRAEVEEIAAEEAAALEGDEEAPEHLTEPLLDPAEAKALAAEMKTLNQAADPDKG